MLLLLVVLGLDAPSNRRSMRCMQPMEYGRYTGYVGTCLPQTVSSMHDVLHPGQTDGP